MADPATKAIDLGDGTYAMAIASMTPTGSNDTVFSHMEKDLGNDNPILVKAYDNGDNTYSLAVEVA